MLKIIISKKKLKKILQKLYVTMKSIIQIILSYLTLHQEIIFGKPKMIGLNWR